MRAVTMALVAVLVCGCSAEAPKEEQKAEKAPPAPGLYEASWTVANVASTDRTQPATELEQGSKGTARGCIGANGTIEPALFAEGEDTCTTSTAYVRGGRMAMQLECRRDGANGQVMQSVNGTTTADGFEAEVSSTTYLAGAGDYEMIRNVSARRTGECPPADTAETAD